MGDSFIGKLGDIAIAFFFGFVVALAWVRNHFDRWGGR